MGKQTSSHLPFDPSAALRVCTAHLLQLVGDHGERPEDAVRGAGDGDDPLGAGALRDVDTRAALWGTKEPKRKLPNHLRSSSSVGRAQGRKRTRRRGLFQKLLPQLKAAELNFVFCL